MHILWICLREGLEVLNLVKSALGVWQYTCETIDLLPTFVYLDLTNVCMTWEWPNKLCGKYSSSGLFVDYGTGWFSMGVMILLHFTQFHRHWLIWEAFSVVMCEDMFLDPLHVWNWQKDFTFCVDHWYMSSGCKRKRDACIFCVGSSSPWL